MPHTILVSQINKVRAFKMPFHFRVQENEEGLRLSIVIQQKFKNDAAA